MKKKELLNRIKDLEVDLDIMIVLLRKQDDVIKEAHKRIDDLEYLTRTTNA